MNARNRMMGRRYRGAVRAAAVLTAAVAAVLVLSGSEEWVATPLPDGTTLYVRYGAPGGVRIVRGQRAEAAAPDSAASSVAVSLGAATPGTVMPSGAPAAPPVAWADSLAAQIRRILAEELAALPASMRTEVQYEWSPAPPAVTSVTPLPGPAPEPAPTDTLAVASVPRLAIVDSVAIPPAPGIAASPQSPMPVPPESPVAGLAPQPRTVREAFASDGLFTTQLLLFETGKSELLPFSQDILRVVAGVLREFPEARIRVEGYTDRRGRADVNLSLSQRRAEAVRDFLAGEGGLGPDRVEAVGYGEQNPVVEGSSPTALALNRRVQIRVLNPEALRRSVQDR